MNKTISRYISRNILYPKLIAEAPSEHLGIIVAIPCYDEPNVCASVEAIAQCQCPECDVEVIISINASVDSDNKVKERNLKSESELLELRSRMPNWLNIYPIVNNDLPIKKAGVGLGRKIGMDEALRRFVAVGKENGVIVCFDADSQCDKSYMTEIELHFENPKCASASINYEHPIDGDKYSPEIYHSIIQYELHLRYFIHMQKRFQLPFAFHTVGSSMACTALAYCAVGGMNQRKAGEDFYFIHKLVKYGKHSKLNTTRVIPSPRISNRVPFGTGKAVGKMQEADEKEYFTYHPQSFWDLKFFIDDLPNIYKNQQFSSSTPQILMQFLESINANSELQRILNNTSDYHSFQKKFWHWFDAFVLMKYLHFARELDYSDLPVLEAAQMVETKSFESARQALIYYRHIDLL